MADDFIKHLKKTPGFWFYPAVIAGFEFVRMGLFITVLPGFLTRVLGHGTTLVGLVLALNLLVDNLLKAPFGALVDRKGPWPILCLGSFLLIIGFSVLIGSHHVWGITLAAFIIGIALSPSWPGVIAGATHALGEEYRGRAISTVSSIWLAGGGLGPVISGWIIGSTSASQGYSRVFLLLGSICLITAVLTVIGWIHFKRLPYHSSTDKTSSKTWSFRSIGKDLAGGFILIPGMLTQTLALGMLVPNLLPFALSQYGMTEAHYSLLLLIGGSATVALMIPVGHLADRYGPRRFLAGGFALASATLWLMLGQKSMGPVFLLVSLLGAAYALIQPSWNTLLTGVIPTERRGTAMGLFMAVEGLGMAVGPALGGYLGDIQRFLPFWIGAGTLGVMSFVYLLIPLSRQKSEVEHNDN